MAGEQLLDVLESMRAEESSIDRLVGEAERAKRKRRRIDPALAREGLALITKVFQGNRYAIATFQEAMTTDDFPQLFGQVLDRVLLAGYQETNITYDQYLNVGEVRDFRNVDRYRVDGAEGPLAIVDEQEEYPEAALTDDVYQYRVRKYGRRLPFSWETMINDDLGAFRNSVERLGRAARRTEERFATDLFVDANGPDHTFFAAGNANVVTGNPTLSIAALQVAFAVLMAQTDSDGEPIEIEGVHLVVPPALMVTALNIVNALQIETVEQGGTANQRVIAANWMKDKVTVHVNRYIPKIAVTSNGSTSWFLFAEPNNRGAAEVGFLRGHRDPELFVKDSNARRIGGGATDPLDGDFDTDTVEYKVRHVMGGTLLDPKMAVASEGDNT